MQADNSGHNESIQSLRDKNQALHDEAVEAFEEGDFPKVETILRNALTLLAEGGDELEKDRGVAMNTLAGALRYMDRLPEAIELSKESVALLSRHLPDDDYDLAAAHMNLAYMLNATEMPVEAAEYLKISHSMMTRALGEDHPQLALVYQLQAQIHLELDDALQAEAAYHKMIEQLRHDTLHENTPDLITDYASLLFEQGREDEACAVFDSAQQMMHEAYSSDYTEDMRDPTYVLSYDRARFTIQRRRYQRQGILPDRMEKLLWLRAGMMVEMERIDEAVDLCRKVEENFEASRSAPPLDELDEEKMDFSRVFADDDELGLQDMEDFDELAELDEGFGPDSDDADEADGSNEDLDGAIANGIEDLLAEGDANMPPNPELGQFHFIYGTALQYQGQDRDNDKLILQAALDNFKMAEKILLANHLQDESIYETLRENIGEVEQDLRAV